MSEETAKIVMYELEKNLDGTFRIGNSFFCGRAEAVKRIKDCSAKHPNLPIGSVPPEWQEVSNRLQTDANKGD